MTSCKIVVSAMLSWWYADIKFIERQVFIIMKWLKNYSAGLARYPVNMPQYARTGMVSAQCCWHWTDTNPALAY